MQPQQQLPSNMPMPVTLTVQDWTTILNMLAEAPYKISAPLVQAIVGQIQSQSSPPERPPVPGNGLDVHEDERLGA